MIANIIPEKRNFDKETYSYIVPADLTEKIKVGSVCYIPFGKKKIRGIVSKLQGTRDKGQEHLKLKEIIDISNIFIPEQYLDITRWISEYYLCSLGEAISLFLPPDIKRPRIKEKIISNKAVKEIELNYEQEIAFERLVELYNDKKSKVALLHGVTGSGKTEIYLKLAKKVTDLGRQVIVLVPEIMLTPQIIERFENHFPNQTALIHSNLSKSERYLSYIGFQKGDKKILIGPRSALLVPSENIGAIIIDEEQEDAYKQEKAPRYHARELAEQVAEKQNALLILGSATPTIESYFKASNKKYELLTLENRYHKLVLPTAEIVDLKEEIKKDNYSPISIKLQNEISKTLKNKKQTLLFLNRRGMSTFVSCRDCGEVMICPRCKIPLVFHLNDKFGNLNCHHCDYKCSAPSICPSCKSPKIKYFGAGTEKIELEIKKLFPKAKVKTVDSKSITNEKDLVKFHQELKNKTYDIVIGTQVLAKGLDVENVDLVGIISADTGLHLPYYKAEEKTFQIITQVSGRSGRKHNIGKTIIQSYWPDSLAIKLASQHDYKSFYNEEIKKRVELGYPPFTHLVRIISENKSEEKAKDFIYEVASALKQEGVSYIGPGKCFFSMQNYRHRYHLIIKATSLPNKSITTVFKNNPYAIWDVNPTNLL